MMQAHELGHNLGLLHSNEGGVAYGDQSGLSKYLLIMYPSLLVLQLMTLSKSGIQLCCERRTTNVLQRAQELAFRMVR